MIKQTLSSNRKLKNSKNLKTPKFFISYEKRISEQIKHVADKYGLEVIFRRSFSLKSKFLTNPFKIGSSCEVVYNVAYSFCKKYFEETGGTSRRRK